jgi:hypothetical protein
MYVEIYEVVVGEKTKVFFNLEEAEKFKEILIARGPRNFHGVELKVHKMPVKGGLGDERRRSI